MTLALPPTPGLAMLDAAALRRALPMELAVDALEAGFAALDADSLPVRSHLHVPNGELLLMPAHGTAGEGVGVKLVTLNPANAARDLPLIHGVFLLFAPDTLAPEAMMDGAALTSLRTAAVSALATRHLARPDARRLVVFGAGTQAHAHVSAMCAVRPIEQVTIVTRSRPRGEALAAYARELGLEAAVGSADAVRDADVVCTCTTSADPVFRGADVRPGTHVNAIGAYRADLREVDGELLARSTVVVEGREAALKEAGDLIIAIAEGRFAPDRIAGDLSDVVNGRVARTDGDVTVFKSVGLAFEDLVVARAAVDRVKLVDG